MATLLLLSTTDSRIPGVSPISPNGCKLPVRVAVLGCLCNSRGTEGDGECGHRASLNFILIVDTKAQEPVTGNGDDFVIRIGFELSVASVKPLRGALGALHDKSRRLGWLRRGDRADFRWCLGEVGRNLGDFYTQADLTRVGTTAAFGWSTTNALGLQKLSGEIDVRFLEADGIRVCDVVAHYVDRGFGSLQTGQSRCHGRLKTHGTLPCIVISVFCLWFCCVG